VSLVFRGNAADRSEILHTLRELIRKIDVGEVSLEEHGRFLRTGSPQPGRTAPEVTTES
jgi:hypothetical protein